MPDTSMMDEKLQAQVLNYLRTGELFESTLSAFENGTLIVTNQSSTTSEEEVENVVSLVGAHMANRDSYNDSGETISLASELSANYDIGGLFFTFLDPAVHFNHNNASEIV